MLLSWTHPDNDWPKKPFLALLVANYWNLFWICVFYSIYHLITWLRPNLKNKHLLGLIDWFMVKICTRSYVHIYTLSNVSVIKFKFFANLLYDILEYTCTEKPIILHIWIYIISKFYCVYKLFSRVNTRIMKPDLIKVIIGWLVNYFRTLFPI